MKVLFYAGSGYECAALGNGLSFGKTSGRQLGRLAHREITEIYAKAAKHQVGRGGGHDKFLRMIVVHADITAPLYWWKQFDTYKIGTVALSESTMHTLLTATLSQDNFEDPINPLTLLYLKWLKYRKNFTKLNNELPHSYLQRRIVCLNYEVINNILKNRSDHKLPQWRFFCNQARSVLPYPELLYKSEKGN